jgi:hypothetical protein
MREFLLLYSGKKGRFFLISSLAFHQYLSPFVIKISLSITL